MEVLRIRTFIDASTRRQKCKVENQSVEDEKIKADKRRQAQEDRRVQLQTNETAEENSEVIDKLLIKLKNGEPMTARKRRAKVSDAQSTYSLKLKTSAPADMARDMLAQLQSNGFDTPNALSTPSNSAAALKAKKLAERAASMSASVAPLLQGPELMTEVEEDDDSMQIVASELGMLSQS